MKTWKLLCVVRVKGTPKPAGSKSYLGQSKAGRGILVDSSGVKGKAWRSDVRDATQRTYVQDPIQKGVAVRTHCVFFKLRPKSHYGSGSNASKLKASAPDYPVTRPDSTKLWRAVEDALTGILWQDDSQIIDQHVNQVYASYDGMELAVYYWDEE